MKTNIINISPPISFLAKLWFLSYGGKYCWPIKLQDSFKCNISRKKQMANFIFDMQINIKVFYKLILSFWVFVARHTQSTQSKKFACLYNISRKMGRIKLLFLLADKHKSFLQVDSITLGTHIPVCPKCSK